MRIKIEFEIELPDGNYTDEEINEFVRFEYADNGCMSSENPIDCFDIEPIFGTFNWKKS